jgi:hypothetical protein
VTLEDLIDQIHRSSSKSIAVDRTKVITGNADQSGNYEVVELTLGSERIKFDNSTGKWQKS